MEPIDGYDYLCVPFIRSCVLLLMVLLDLYMFIIGGVGLAYTCGPIVNWLRCFVFVFSYICV